MSSQTRTNPDTIRIAMIYGSTREGRYCDRVIDWARTQINDQADFELDVVDPMALALPLRHGLPGNDAAITELKQRIDAADAFIVATPEYNHGYPAALKFLIDSVYEEWQAKPVAFISYGASSGGLRAVEQLRQVFAELHTVSMRDSVAFVNVWDQFDEAGQLRAPERLNRTLHKVLNQLRWWATVLRAARRDTPYRSVA
ncbi:MAG TPA: NAD(P)H-dependent oxidoreductase [Dongiaceae bacterium]|nr:NAD(P)H-dependent oxidoreductase [Dongiaceae bacterium]